MHEFRIIFLFWGFTEIVLDDLQFLNYFFVLTIAVSPLALCLKLLTPNRQVELWPKHTATEHHLRFRGIY